MGVKAVYGILAMSALSTSLFVVGLCLPQHRMKFFTAWFISVATMETHATFVTFPIANVRFCDSITEGAEQATKREAKRAKGGVVQAAAGAKDQKFQSWCASLSKTENIGVQHDIQDAAMHMCAPAISVIWPQFCNGLNMAYALGMTLVIVAAANGICQLVGCYLLYDYITRKANPKYRTFGIAILAIGGFAMFVMVCLYGMMVLSDLDSIGGASWVMAMLTTGKNTGYGPGYVCLCCGCGFTFFSALWTPFIEKEFEETTYLEDKQEKQEERELKHDENYGTMGDDFGQSLMPPGPMMTSPGMMPVGGLTSMVSPMTMGYQQGPSQPVEQMRSHY